MWNDFGVNFGKENVQNDLSIPHPNDSTRKIHIIPDPVHVFKNMVNGWINNKYLTVPEWYVKKKGLISNIVHRDHLKVMVDYEGGNQLRMCHKLSFRDVCFDRPVPSVDKMKVCNSTKYCNLAVSAGLRVVAARTNRPELETTASVIEDLAVWFDRMNNRNDERALRRNDAEIVDQLNSTVRLVYDLKVGEDQRWKPWKTGVAMCTNAVHQLTSFLLDNGHNQILTARFVQDCLESLFSTLLTRKGIDIT